jgi:hypothetical protein
MSADDRMNRSIYGPGATASGDRTLWPLRFQLRPGLVQLAALKYVPHSLFRQGIVGDADILEGRHPAPPEFAPLYAVLSAIAAQHTAALRIRSAALQCSCLPALDSPLGLPCALQVTSQCG